MNSRHTFLVDTGDEISVILPPPGHRPIPFMFRLKAANGSKIQTYDTKEANLHLGLRRNFTRKFVAADVNILILEANFLSYYNLYVHMHN